MGKRREGSLRPIVIEGHLNQSILDQLRARLGLEPAGRLEDSEDVGFGNRNLREDAAGSVWLELSRVDDARFYPDSCPWRFEWGYTGERPSADMIEQWRSQIIMAIKDLGLSVRKMRHW